MREPRQSPSSAREVAGPRVPRVSHTGTGDSGPRGRLSYLCPGGVRTQLRADHTWCLGVLLQSLCCHLGEPPGLCFCFRSRNVVGLAYAVCPRGHGPPRCLSLTVEAQGVAVVE